MRTICAVLLTVVYFRASFSFSLQFFHSSVRLFSSLRSSPIQTCRKSIKQFTTESSVIQAEGSGSHCRIKVIGVGGGGGNAVNRMVESGTAVLGVEMWTVNTDAQALSRSLAAHKLNIGTTTSRYSNSFFVIDMRSPCLVSSTRQFVIALSLFFPQKIANCYFASSFALCWVFAIACFLCTLIITFYKYKY